MGVIETVSSTYLAARE